MEVCYVQSFDWLDQVFLHDQKLLIQNISNGVLIFDWHKLYLFLLVVSHVSFLVKLLISPIFLIGTIKRSCFCGGSEPIFSCLDFHLICVVRRIFCPHAYYKVPIGSL